MSLPGGHDLSLDAEIEHQARLGARFPGCPVLDIALAGRADPAELPSIFQKVSTYPGICLMRIH